MLGNVCVVDIVVDIVGVVLIVSVNKTVPGAVE